MTGEIIDRHEHRLPLIEINTFGQPGDARTGVVFWDWNGHVRDWRWWNEGLRPDEIGPRRWLSAWTERSWAWNEVLQRWAECHTLFRVWAEHVLFTRTLKDREVEDRAEWPLERRRLL